MARLAMMMACLSGACKAAQFSDSFLGTWEPVGRTVKAILGPVNVLTFTMAKHTSNGDYFMSYLPGQVFRIRENAMQYCFARVATSPFVVDKVEDNFIRFCYKTGDRMPSHKALDDGTLATGCDASKIELELHDDGTMEFSFYMSPPIRHAWAVYKRIGPAPPIATYGLLGGKCDPMHPGKPTLGDEPDNSTSGGELAHSMCPSLQYNRQKQLELPTPEDDQEDGEWEEGQEELTSTGLGQECRALDGGVLSTLAKNEDKAWVKLRWQKPLLRCWPCKVSYSVSAKISEDEYLAFGFKGMAYRTENLGKFHPPERPCYFGMCLDDVDRERTGNANMVLGYAGGSAGSCVRQMESPGYASEPSDVAGNPDVFDYSVERKNGRTIINFKLLQHVGRNDIAIYNFYNLEEMAARTMWAVGSMQGSGCDATPQFHRARGLGPLAWFMQNPRGCSFNANEFGHSLDGEEVSV